MVWYEDYYLGSSDYPLSGSDRHESEEDLEIYGPPPEAEHVPALLDALERLTPKQRFVIELSWGLRGERPHSFAEIADFMGVAHQVVHEHHGAAMKKLEKTLQVGCFR